MRRSIALLAVVAMLAVAAAAWAVVPAGPDTYEGKTGQGKPVFVKVNDKSRIKDFLIKYKAKCGNSGNTYTGVIRDHDKDGDRITQQNGVFSGKATKNEDAGGGYKGHVTLTYEGKFTTKTAANGTSKIKVKVTYGGETVASCSKSPSWQVSNQ